MTRKGFSLIELLVVVLIMGILAFVVMPQYFKSVEKSRSAEAIAFLKATASAYQRHYMQKGRYPTGCNVYDFGRTCFSQLDIGMPKLSYFTVYTIGEGFNYSYIIGVQRKTSAGGGLGSYTISLKFAGPHGNLNDAGSAMYKSMQWYCDPTPQCNSFLPN